MNEGHDKNGTFGRIADLPISPREYYELVTRFNRLIQNELAEKLAQRSDEFGSAVTLVTPGSDGRLEKGSQVSALEIIALIDEKVDIDLFEKTLTETLSKISATRISKIIEVKDPETKLAIFKGNPRIVQPGRIADSRPVYGSRRASTNAKIQLGKEIIASSSGEIVGRVGDLRKDARRATREGRNRIGGKDAIHFDLETGVVYFDPTAHQLSFKIGPLRLVQNTLLGEEIKHTRTENEPNFISTLNSNIVRRLGQLSEDKLVNLSRSSVREIMDHYAFFLRLYHRSEHAYDQRGEVTLQLDKSEIEEVARRLQALSALMEDFKIKKHPQ
ncbi:hypothetical protein HY968_01800 [Candidatus Kaiserbacteria bacterium]|nr:hypothetical protein [Candidatus Kaiserbacteria bacterium]